MTRLEPSQYHIPVMATECLDFLAIRPDGHYADATLGGGGHTSLILERLGGSGRVTSFDADDVAIAHCRSRFSAELERGPASRLALVHANFDTMPDVLATTGGVDGILFDLGVSSYQFDHHERGFSYRMMAPLDMRFTPEGPTAADLLNGSSEADLAHMFFTYGEDPAGRSLARAVVQRRALAPFRTTGDVRDVVIQRIPPHHQAKTMARIFQALRIAVNNELERLQRTLTAILGVVRPGGRIVVMSYHSLEDRIVKDVFRDHKDLLTILTKKPVEASDAEQEANPRSRSARLRAAERRHEHQGL
ncbi:MAG: 16S rRNA (cytosine(1402)-N(4))-methyltransferase RsmH [Candidatus Kapabacteria bacterium]|nr:16S rRNA (cytosine(1402)-N(4))-methyltransferase RsmH [Candidatus Kapabacteria bacterium]